jgi:hypothetical protein
MPISSSFGSQGRDGPSTAATASGGHGKGAAALLESHLREAMAQRPSTARSKDLRQAIILATSTLSDPCSDERLLSHLKDMAALLCLVEKADHLAPGVARQLPDRASLQRDMASTAERVYRKIALQVYGLREALRKGQGNDTEPLRASMMMLRTLEQISVQLRDGASTYAVFTAANNIGRHASKDAHRIAETFAMEVQL